MSLKNHKIKNHKKTIKRKLFKKIKLKQKKMLNVLIKMITLSRKIINNYKINKKIFRFVKHNMIQYKMNNNKI